MTTIVSLLMRYQGVLDPLTPKGSEEMRKVKNIIKYLNKRL